MDNLNTASAKPSVDIARWVLALLLVGVAVVGNAYYADQPFLYRLIGVVVLMAVSIFVASTTSKGVQLVALFKDARAEVRRVVWPTKQETWTTAAIVVVVVLISALILWGVDYVLGSLVSNIIG